MKELISILSASLGAVVGFLIGDLTGLVIALLVFIIIDYITGVLDAIYKHNLSSSVGFIGILRKIVIIIVVCVGHMIDAYLLGGGSVIRDACIFFYISNEGISILENIVDMGVPVPAKLKAILEQIKEESENGENNTETN